MGCSNDERWQCSEQDQRPTSNALEKLIILHVQCKDSEKSQGSQVSDERVGDKRLRVNKTNKSISTPRAHVHQCVRTRQNIICHAGANKTASEGVGNVCLFVCLFAFDQRTECWSSTQPEL
jgi:hypothetical protein